ncbi:RNA methyltransferase [Sporomusa aerivorans]|uniref:RNA methyltransferase n=1 Tax=Sporomusa aerivorans TaxID=204936 RepID=UPI003529F7B1
MALPVYLGLVHYPIYNKNNEIVTTAITNFDIHDIARTARTYDVLKYFIIHPHDAQKALAAEIISYWQDGYGGQYNPDRKEALSIVEVIPDIAAAINYVTDREGIPPLVVTTDARKYANTVSYRALQRELEKKERPCLLLFGTGWGMENSVMKQFGYILEPIYGPGTYNHLPVRAAVAIILDRLLGEHWWVD